MLKNKTFNKFVSVFCSILTLTSVTSLSQTKVDALQIETKPDEDGYEYTTATLDKPFYYITVYDKQLSTTYTQHPYLSAPLKGCRSNWKEVGLMHCLEVDNINAGKQLTAEETDISSYRQKLKDVFSNAADSDEIALALAVGETERLKTFPKLPWMLVLTPTRTYLDTKAEMRKLINQEPMFLPKVKKDGEEYIPCIDVPKYHTNSPTLQAVPLTDGREDVKIYSAEEWLQKWHEQANIMTVGDLKDWINHNNKALAKELGI